MKVAHAQTHVKGSHGIQESKGFSIRTNAHAFKMLSSGLYSDKVRAVLREIGCNAVDAHIAQGTPDLPIEVKVPNRIDRQFYVKDWGPGLSHDDVMNLYTTYFASTKQTSNDYTGAFGLGSKSPFSYTDAFVVTSVHGGKKRTYSAHLGDAGVPTVALLTTEDTDADWQHGVMVGFPVKPEDVQQFAQKTQQVYQWFRVPPRIVGASAIQPLELAVDEPHVMRVRGMTDSGVLMGGVFYPLAVHNLPGIQPEEHMFFSFPGLVLRLPIGAVQVAGSREEIQFGKDEVALLLKACDSVALQVAKEMNDAVLAFNTAKWSDKCTMREVASRWVDKSSRIHWPGLLNTFGYATAAAGAQVITNRSVELPAYAGDKTLFRVVTASGKMGKVEHHNVYAGQTSRGTRTFPATLSLEADTAIYHGRVSRALPRAKHLVTEGKHKQVVLILPSPQKGSDDKDAAAQARKLAAELGGVPVLDIATAPLPPNYVVQKKGVKAAKKAPTTTPLPSIKVRTLDLKGQDDEVDLSRVDQHFMCKVYNGYSVRRYEKTMDSDTIHDLSSWKNILANLDTLQGGIGVTLMREHLYLRVDDIRKYDLVKRGFRPTQDVIREWLISPTTTAALMQNVNTWMPSVRLYGAESWVHALVLLRHEHKALYDTCTISDPALARAIEDIHKESKRQGNAAGRKEPPELTAFNILCTRLGVNQAGLLPPATRGQRKWLDVPALNAQLLARCPVLEAMDDSTIFQLVEKAPGALPDFFKLAGI